MNTGAPIPHIGRYPDRFAILRFFEFDQGPVTRMLVNQSALSKALEVQINVAVGDEIRAVRDSRDRAGYFVVAGETREQVLAMEEELLSSVQIEH